MWLTGDEQADALLDSDPFALLIGMLLDQQVTMESAFAGPVKIQQRLGSLDPAAIAAADPEAFADLCRTPPAVHRYPGSMAGRIQDVARAVVTEYGGDITRLWAQPDGSTPDGATPQGWREAAGAYGEEGSRRSIADVTDLDSLHEVRETKQAAKAAAKAAKLTT